MVTNIFGRRTSMDLGCLIDGGLIFTIELATKFGLASKKNVDLACQYSLSPLKSVGLVLFNTNHYRILWEGGAKLLWVFEFQIVILHLRLVLNFSYSPKDGVQSYCSIH